MTGQHEFHQYPACFYDPRALGVYYHTFRDRSMTGANQRPEAFNFDYAKPAGADRRQTFQMTQCGNIDSVLSRYFEDSHPLAPANCKAIQCQRYLGHDCEHYSKPIAIVNYQNLVTRSRKVVIREQTGPAIPKPWRYCRSRAGQLRPYDVHCGLVLSVETAATVAALTKHYASMVIDLARSDILTPSKRSSMTRTLSYSTPPRADPDGAIIGHCTL